MGECTEWSTLYRVYWWRAVNIVPLDKTLVMLGEMLNCFQPVFIYHADIQAFVFDLENMYVYSVLGCTCSSTERSGSEQRSHLCCFLLHVYFFSVTLQNEQVCKMLNEVSKSKRTPYFYYVL